MTNSNTADRCDADAFARKTAPYLLQAECHRERKNNDAGNQRAGFPRCSECHNYCRNRVDSRCKHEHRAQDRRDRRFRCHEVHSGMVAAASVQLNHRRRAKNFRPRRRTLPVKAAFAFPRFTAAASAAGLAPMTRSKSSTAIRPATAMLRPSTIKARSLLE